jgi:hypothetical protein
MNLRQFYSRALIAAIPAAAQMVQAHEELIAADDQDAFWNGDKSFGRIVADLAADMAHHASNDSMDQMLVWDQRTMQSRNLRLISPVRRASHR